MLQDSLNCKKLNKAKNKDLNNEEEPLSILEEEMGEEEVSEVHLDIPPLYFSCHKGQTSPKMQKDEEEEPESPGEIFTVRTPASPKAPSKSGNKMEKPPAEILQANLLHSALECVIFKTPNKRKKDNSWHSEHSPEEIKYRRPNRLQGAVRDKSQTPENFQYKSLVAMENRRMSTPNIYFKEKLFATQGPKEENDSENSSMPSSPKINIHKLSGQSSPNKGANSFIALLTNKNSRVGGRRFSTPCKYSPRYPIVHSRIFSAIGTMSGPQQISIPNSPHSQRERIDSMGGQFIETKSNKSGSIVWHPAGLSSFPLESSRKGSVPYNTNTEEPIEDNSFLDGDTFLATSFFGPPTNTLPQTAPQCYKFEGNTPEMYKNPTELGLYIDRIIGLAPEHSEIYLPSLPIKIGDLYINKSLQIKGSPGTIIQIFGSIIIGSGIVVEFSECEISLNIEGGRDEEEALILFNIEGNLRLTDCLLSSKVNKEIATLMGGKAPAQPELEEDEKYLPVLQDACFFLQNSLSPANCAIIELTSSRIINFFTGLVLGNNSKAGVYQCGIQKCRNSCILAINPASLDVKETLIENSQENGIEIRFSNMGEEGAGSQKSCEIDIERSQIKTMSKSALVILGDAEVGNMQKLSIRVDSNTIQYNKGEGIFIKDLNLNSLEISNNYLLKNSTNGLNLNNIEIIGNKQVNCELNKCLSSSKGNGIVVVDTPVELKQNETSWNFLNGVLLSNEQGGKQHSTPGHSTFRNHEACNNENGMSIIETKYIIHINESKFSNNKKYGIYLAQQQAEGPLNLKKAGELSPPNKSTTYSRNGSLQTPSYEFRNIPSLRSKSSIGVISSRIEVVESEIRNNPSGGIYLDQNLLHLLNTQIRECGDYAIYIPIKQTGKVLTFGQEDTTQYVQGSIGGPWGHLKISSNKTPQWSSSYIAKVKDKKPNDLTNLGGGGGGEGGGEPKSSSKKSCCMPRRKIDKDTKHTKCRII